MRSLILVLIILLITPIFIHAQVIQRVGDAGYIDWTGNTVVATGIALGKADEDNPVKKKLQAKRAAKSVAFRNLAEVINGVNVTSHTVVKNFVTENDEIRLKINSFIRGAVEKEVKYNSDGSCEVTVEAPLDGDAGFTQAFLSAYSGPKVIDQNPVRVVQTVKNTAQKAESVFKDTDTSAPSNFLDKTPPKKEESAPAEKPKTQEEPADTSDDEILEITGILIDLGGKSMVYSLFPQIIDDEGGIVYSITTAENASAKGLASYVKEIEAGKKHKRVKITPIIINASDAKGSTVYISVSDAQKIRDANEKAKVLSNCKVVFVVK